MKETFSAIIARLVKDADLADLIYLMKDGKISRKEFIEYFIRRIKDMNYLDYER